MEARIIDKCSVDASECAAGTLDVVASVVAPKSWEVEGVLVLKATADVDEVQKSQL